jgi:hypothetical protein
MASILNVDQINNAAGTSAVTIDPSTGKPSFPNGATMPAGSVVQVVFADYNTTSSFSSSAGVDTGFDIFSLSITPSSASSKILIIAKGTMGSLGIDYDMSWSLKRGSSRIGGNTNATNFLGTNVHASGAGPNEGPTTMNFQYLDSPATTNATTYTLVALTGETATHYVNRGNSVNSARTWANSGNCSLTLMEIAQ